MMTAAAGAALLQAERFRGATTADHAQAVELRPADRARVDLPGQDAVLAGQAGVGVGEARAGETSQVRASTYWPRTVPAFVLIMRTMGRSSR